MNNNLSITRMDKWSEFIENATHGVMNPTCDEKLSHKNEWSDREPWSGTHSFDEALEHLRNGWEDGIKRLKEFMKGIPPNLYDQIMPIKDFKPEMRHMIAGGGLDVAAHLSGATPETFIGEVIPHEEGQVVKGKKLQTVYARVNNSGVMDGPAFFYRGAYTYALLEHMENCGYSTELWAVSYVKGGWDYNGSGVRQIIYVKVKEFGELLDMNKVAIALCSQFMLRRFMFSIYEQQENHVVAAIANNGYGQPVEWTGDNKISIVLPEDMDANPMFVDTVNESSQEGMLRRFKDILDKHINDTTPNE